MLKILIAFWIIGLVKPSHGQTFDHSLFTEVLQTVVVTQGPISQVHYETLKKNPQKLNSYLKQLESVTKKNFYSWNQNQQYVFWVNAYNAYTLKLIVNNYPLESIKDLGTLFKSPWKKKFFTLLGKQRHLDEVEHKILRVRFNEPRTHFAVNCASIGCPALLNEAFTTEKLEAQLEKQTRAFLKDSSRNRIQGQKLILSKIFKWFKEDFTKNGTVQQFVAKYITDDPVIRKSLKNGDFTIHYAPYDWGLNKVRTQSKRLQSK